MAKPRLLLLDEPFLGLAPLIVADVLAALCRVSDQGVTILLVSRTFTEASSSSIAPMLSKTAEQFSTALASSF